MILIGGGLLALAGTLNGEVGKTGKTILNWSGSVSSIPAGGGIGDNNPDVHTPDPVNGTAFAVYSETDHSLDFYKRKAIPAEGSTFEGKAVTEVYTGFETDGYVITGNSSSWTDQPTNVPWEKTKFDIESINVVDQGIRPKNMKVWFYRFTSLKTADVSNIDCSDLTTVYATFCFDQQLENVSLPSFTSALTTMRSMFAGDSSLESVDFAASDLSGLTNMFHAFMECESLSKVKFPDEMERKPCNAKSLEQLFDQCSSLRSLDFTGFNTSDAYMFCMLGNTTALEMIKVGSTFAWKDGNLPAPNREFIPGADGKWYAESDGKAYTPTNIPSNKADTYYASKSLYEQAVNK